MSDFWHIVLGVLAGLHGLNALEDARKGNLFRPPVVLGAVVAGYLATEHFSRMYAAGGGLRLGALALVLSASSPVIGYVVYGHNGRIMRFLMMSVGFLMLAVIVSVFLMDSLDVPEAAVAGLLTALVPFLPWNSICRKIRSWSQQRSERRLRARQIRLQAREAQKQHQQKEKLRELQLHTKRATRTLKAQESRIAAIERGDQKERERLESLRTEVMEQVRLIRQAEVERVRGGDDGLRLHPHYGHLMNEGWRFLRAEAAGQRSVAVEHDAFYFEVVGEMLKSADFDRRYLHATGRDAVASLNRYLNGQQSFSALQAALEALDWQPELLAPIPVTGRLVPGLLEAWLVPHRRRQNRYFELFSEGGHSHQDELNEFFDQHGIEMPTREEWRALWDKHPEVFK